MSDLTPTSAPDPTSQDTADLDAQRAATEAFDAPEVKKVMDEAKKSFSLADRLKGFNRGKAKVMLFPDLSGVEALDDAKRRLALVNDTIATSTDINARERLEAEMTALEDEVEEKKKALLETALVVHLRALPNVVVKVARRDARRKFALNDGVIPNDKMEAFSEHLGLLMLKDAIEKIVAVDGELELGEDVATQLADLLPPAQWSILDNALNKLLFEDNVSKLATDDPGF